MEKDEAVSDPLARVLLEKWMITEDDWCRTLIKLQNAKAALATILIPGMRQETMIAVARQVFEDGSI